MHHDPDRQGEVKRRRRRGGFTRLAQKSRAITPEEVPGPLDSLEAIEAALETVHAKVATGDIDPPRGQVLGKLLQTLHACRLKRERMEERLRDVERGYRVRA
ncbi:MAG TPA: hypothetical protein VML95_12015 [Longimicrobiales bacterium]|nr:hypothetical protein [Longimicrobiales bacterium]